MQENFSVGMKPELRAKMDALADHYGLPRGNLIQMLITERYQEIFQSIQPKSREEPEFSG